MTLLLVMLILLVGFWGQAGWLSLLMTGLGGPGLVTAVQAGAMVLMGAFLAIMLLLIVAPTMRQHCEVVAAAALLFELLTMGLAWGGTSFSTPLLAICSFALIALGIDHLIYGRLLDMFGLWRPLVARHSFATGTTPHAVWNAIVPRPETVSTHWIGALTEVSHTREKDVFVARYRLGDGTVLRKRLTFLDSDHPQHMRYHFEPETEAEDSDTRFGAGFFELWVEPQDDDITQVTIACEYTALRARTALMLWMDDWLGSEGDAMAAFMEQRPDRSLHTKLWGEVLRQAA